jgi:hypothetical protein
LLEQARILRISTRVGLHLAVIIASTVSNDPGGRSAPRRASTIHPVSILERGMIRRRRSERHGYFPSLARDDASMTMVGRAGAGDRLADPEKRGRFHRGEIDEGGLDGASLFQIFQAYDFVAGRLDPGQNM